MSVIILQNSTLKINYNGIKGLENTVRKCEGDIEFRGRAWLLHGEGFGEAESSLDMESSVSPCMEEKTWEIWCN